MYKKILWAAAVASLLSLTSCSKPAEKTAVAPTTPAPAAVETIQVVATFSVLGNLVQEIGGERVQVSTLVGADQDAHVFQPTPQDIQKIASAKVLVSNGLGFEGWLDRLNQAASFKGVHSIATTGMTPLKMAEDEGEHKKDGHEHHDEFDPHAWQDIHNVKDFYVKNILASLIQADPAGKDYYTQRANAYTQKLVELDVHLKEDFDKIPAGKRKVVTSHDAFGYFGKRYGIQFLAPQGISTDSEASAKTVAVLIRQIKQEQVKSIFFENISNTKLMEQITKETGATIGGKLHSDALSNKEGPASTYLKMMSSNAHIILDTMK